MPEAEGRKKGRVEGRGVENRDEINKVLFFNIKEKRKGSRTIKKKKKKN
jgi:hypothetical protein